MHRLSLGLRWPLITVAPCQSSEYIDYNHLNPLWRGTEYVHIYFLTTQWRYSVLNEAFLQRWFIQDIHARHKLDSIHKCRSQPFWRYSTFPKTSPTPYWIIIPFEHGVIWTSLAPCLTASTISLSPSSTVSANFPDHDPLFMRVYEIGFRRFPRFVYFVVFRSRRPLLLLAYSALHNCRTWTYIQESPKPPKQRSVFSHHRIPTPCPRPLQPNLKDWQALMCCLCLTEILHITLNMYD